MESLIFGLVAVVSSLYIFWLGLRIQQDAKKRDTIMQKRRTSQESVSSVSASPDLAAKIHPNYIHINPS